MTDRNKLDPGPSLAEVLAGGMIEGGAERRLRDHPISQWPNLPGQGQLWSALAMDALQATLGGPLRAQTKSPEELRAMLPKIKRPGETHPDYAEQDYEVGNDTSSVPLEKLWESQKPKLQGWLTNSLMTAPLALPAGRGMMMSAMESAALKRAQQLLHPGEQAPIAPNPIDPPTYTSETAPQYRLTPEQRTKMEALGYDPDARFYRGGNREFAGVEDPKGNYGFKFLADHPAIANYYTSGTRGLSRVTPLVAKKGNTFEVDYGGKSWSERFKPAEAANMTRDPDLAKRATRMGMEDFAKYAKDKGYDMAAFRNLSDMGGTQSQYIPLKPNTLRSPWAKFDPAQADSGNIMAGLTGLLAGTPLSYFLMSGRRPDDPELANALADGF